MMRLQPLSHRYNLWDSISKLSLLVYTYNYQACCRWSTDIHSLLPFRCRLGHWHYAVRNGHYQLNRVNYWAARRTRIKAHSRPFVNCVVATRLITNNVDANKLHFVQLFSNDRSFARPLKEKQGSGSGKCRRGCSVTQKTRQMKQKWMEKSCLPI